MALRAAISRSFQTSPRSIGGPRFASTWWGHVEPAPKDPILGVTEAFLADPSPSKVNVGVGAYRDDDGKPVVLDCVREAEARIAGNLNMEYLPMGGSNKMVEETLKLAYGENFEFIKDNRIAVVQALSGTGACRLFADFQKHFYPESEIYIPVPTWSKDAHVSQKTYHYYHPETKGLHFSAMMDDIKSLVEEQSWPYCFPKSDDFPSCDQRGNVTGRLLVKDSYMSGDYIPASAAYVGLALPWKKVFGPVF